MNQEENIKEEPDNLGITNQDESIIYSAASSDTSDIPDVDDDLKNRIYIKEASVLVINADFGICAEMEMLYFEETVRCCNQREARRS
jgi:hypothetical protein